jgi:hypothetical protein
VIISHSHRFVVLMPWKTASSTIRGRLGGYCESPYDAFYHLNPHLDRVVHQHMSYADFKALPESRLGYRTAAFVRNPYDRVYSGFVQLQRDICEQPKAVFTEPAVRSLVMAQRAENHAQLRRAEFSFETWVELLDDRQVLDARGNSSFPLQPAHYWTHEEGRQAVDFVGRVETFEQDFARLCDELGVTPVASVNANVSTPDGLPGAADSDGYRYVGRISSRARRRINELFREDLRAFGYRELD